MYCVSIFRTGLVGGFVVIVDEWLPATVICCWLGVVDDVMNLVLIVSC